MLHPSLDTANSSVLLADRSTARRELADVSRERPVAVPQRCREEERPSLVCAARWAY